MLYYEKRSLNKEIFFSTQYNIFIIRAPAAHAIGVVFMQKTTPTPQSCT